MCSVLSHQGNKTTGNFLPDAEITGQSVCMLRTKEHVEKCRYSDL